MPFDLHVLARGDVLESFGLSPGIHLLGSGAGADLLLSTSDAPSEVCRIELQPDGTVALRASGELLLQRFDGAQGEALTLANGDFAEIAGLRLLVLSLNTGSELMVTPAPAVALTAPSTGIRPPPRETLGLKVTVRGRSEVVALRAGTLRLGRGPGNDVAFVHPEVSRRHAVVVRKPDGFWIQDLGGTHGTLLDGVKVTAAAWPTGGRVHLSMAADAPLLELLPLTELLAGAGGDEALSLLRGRSLAIKAVNAQLLRFGEEDEPVLLLGENGTGKELAARTLWRLRGQQRPFVPVNCGALSASMIEGQLFGHRRGAFTGAVADQAGFFEAAKDGVVFLDEIGELPLSLQPRLLRVLEDRTVQRLGETQPRPVRARVVAATNRNLMEMVQAGTFREDLFHRLGVFIVQLPPLRARPEDIPELTRLVLQERRGKSGGKTLSDAALEKLMAQPWPGNVRQLRHEVLRAAVATAASEIGVDAIVVLAPGTETLRRPQGIENMPAYLADMEKALCERALAEVGGKVTKAAKLLGIDESSMRRAIKRHGLQPAT